jgi:hypothetical protein
VGVDEAGQQHRARVALGLVAVGRRRPGRDDRAERIDLEQAVGDHVDARLGRPRAQQAPAQPRDPAVPRPAHLVHPSGGATPAGVPSLNVTSVAATLASQLHVSAGL